MISLQKKFIFIHAPKTAGNSIQRVLEPYSEDKIIKNHRLHDGVERFELHSPYAPSGKHATLREYRARIDPDLYSGLFKFCCARNPWDRAISYYFHFNGPGRGFVDGPVSTHASAEAKRTGNPTFAYWDRQRFIQMTQVHLPSIFAHIYTGDRMQLDSSFEPLDEVDRIIKFENLNADFSPIISVTALSELSQP